MGDMKHVHDWRGFIVPPLAFLCKRALLPLS